MDPPWERRCRRSQWKTRGVRRRPGEDQGNLNGTNSRGDQKNNFQGVFTRGPIPEEDLNRNLGETSELVKGANARGNSSRGQIHCPSGEDQGNLSRKQIILPPLSFPTASSAPHSNARTPVCITILMTASRMSTMNRARFSNFDYSISDSIRFSMFAVSCLAVRFMFQFMFSNWKFKI